SPHHRFPFPSARAENLDRAHSPAIRPGPPHREPSLPEPFGSVAATIAADTRHLSRACARHEGFPSPDHQLFPQVRVGPACKSYIPRCKSVSNSGRAVATPLDTLSRFPIAESPGVANRRMLRKNFRVPAAIIPPCVERVAVRNFSPPYRAV